MEVWRIYGPEIRKQYHREEIKRVSWQENVE